MTNTEAIKPFTWTRPGGIPSGYSTSATELLRLAAPAPEVEELAERLTRVRGAHRVTVSARPGRVVGGEYVASEWFSLSFRGTERAVRGARNLLMLSGLQEVDPNADHDHEECVASAQKMGVPAAWAHSPETYLSM